MILYAALSMLSVIKIGPDGWLVVEPIVDFKQCLLRQTKPNIAENNKIITKNNIRLAV